MTSIVEESDIVEITESQLPYLSPLTLSGVKAEMKKGKFGVYQSGYRVEFTLADKKTKVSVTAKRGTDWFARLSSIRVVHPSIKTFSFEFDDMAVGNRNIAVSPVLEENA